MKTTKCEVCIKISPKNLQKLKQLVRKTEMQLSQLKETIKEIETFNLEIE